MKVIARIENDFDSKFGIPRQSGMVATTSRIVFEPEYRIAEAVREIETFDYVWLIWEFSEARREAWSPTVRPPRLGGNRRIGVFATRSPFRPNPIGLSSVRLLKVEMDATLGPVLYVAGADLMNGTPIYDIKPYLPYADSHPEAHSGYATTPTNHRLTVDADPEVLNKIPEAVRQPLYDLLALDPRPQYQHNEDRLYGMSYAGGEVHFTVKDNSLHITQWTDHGGQTRR